MNTIVLDIHSVISLVLSESIKKLERLRKNVTVKVAFESNVNKNREITASRNLKD